MIVVRLRRCLDRDNIRKLCVMKKNTALGNTGADLFSVYIYPL